MTDNQAQAGNTPVADQPVAQAQAPAVQPAPAPAQAPETDRTREQFEKLLDSNKKLFEANELLRKEIAQRGQANQQFAPIQQTPLVQQAQNQGVNPRDFIEVDPSTGERFINEQKLRNRVEELEQKASRAEQTVNDYIKTSEQREIERQEREAFNSYPELNPGAKQFNVGFHNQTRAVIYDSLINPQDYGGRPLSFKDAADFVKTQFMGQTAAPTVEAKPEELEAQQAASDAQDFKQQTAAQAQAAGQPNARAQIADTEHLAQLSDRTRRGDLEALAIRLANLENMGNGTRSDKAS